MWNLPVFLVGQYSDELDYCYEEWPLQWYMKAYSLGWLIVIGILPLSIMTGLYGCVVYTLLGKWSHKNGSPRESCLRSVLASDSHCLCTGFLRSQVKRGDIVQITTVVLVTLNSAVNPIIYCFQSERFRTCVKALVFTPCLWRRRALVKPKIPTNGTVKRGSHGNRSRSNLHPTHTV